MTDVPVSPLAQSPAAMSEPANLGDIRVSLLDIELLTIKLRLVVCSVETAAQMGIDWWRHDPWLTSAAPADWPAGAVPGGRPRELESE